MTQPDFGLIKQAIHRSGGRWTPGKTSYSHAYGTVEALSPNRFGLNIRPEDNRRAVTATRSLETNMFKVVAPPPPKLDWRKKGNKNYVTKIRDQQNCGACVAFATCAVLESRAIIAAEKHLDFDLSEAHLFYCGTKNACEIGWDYVPALEACQKTGVGLEKDFPYTPGNQACVKIDPVIKVRSYATASSSTARKQALQKGPVIGGMKVFEDFFTYKKGVYSHVSGQFAGWHAVAIIGYDDTEACWIVKNSWGTGWGEKGFFRIAYGECAIDSQVLFYDPDIALT